MYLRFKLAGEKIVRYTLLACLPVPREYTMENAAMEKKGNSSNTNNSFSLFLVPTYS